MRFAPSLAVVALLVLPFIALAQSPASPVFDSVVVNPDHTVTFKYLDPSARKAELSLEGAAASVPMLKGNDGVWSATSQPLTAQIYGYHFDVDDQPRLDLQNTHVTTNLLNLSNLVTVPGDPVSPWEPQAIPHGEVHHHTYTTSVVLGLPRNQSDFLVYTPPGYDPRAKTAYPVLYLLHGYSDRADGWIAVGKANFILDALIAQNQIKPMVVVMPLGYGNMSFVLGSGHDHWSTPSAVSENTDLFSKALLTEILPRVESEYRVSKKREDRAIAGLSMGGLESLSTGLNNTDKFAYIGGFSSAAASVDRTRLASLDPKTANLKLLWIACGTEDHLITPNRDFIAFLKSKGMAVTAIETPGMHTWMVWRDNLVHIAPLLFRK